MTLAHLRYAPLLLLAGCATPSLKTVPPSDHFDGTRFFNPDGVQGSSGEQKQGPIALFRNLVKPPYRTWPKSVPVTPSHPPARVDGQTMRVTWIGHSTMLVQTQGLNILTDPLWVQRASPVQFLGVKRVRQPGVRIADLPRIDLILLSHDHRDHLDMTAMRRLWHRDRPLIVTGLGTDQILRRSGIHAVSRDWGGRVALRTGIDVIVDRAHHWSEYDPGDRNKTLWAGFTVTLPGGNLYFAGDTGPGDMRWATEARAAGPVRLAILPIGAYHFAGHETDNHIGPDQAVTAFEQLGAAYAIGVHWGTFELTAEGIDEPPEHLRSALAREHIEAGRFRTPGAGEAWVIE
ncbi:MBL fold metallo-hydrolase [Sphingomonas sp. PP-CC-3A-396]|uniref:MBL fold metallo-hydrolase n=1 Tax=Sphingomonas sp. PP-CC-3A-396 TaxID=2135655 RepID=UPI001052D2D0|nr:MBL fold metallo-hydrolase [Sphingomonas sp. PP-CC-3A-396]TCQ09099.1 L-ascorbate metabolism protein UlaG (beta-lactamase superfamily) [Sphingomonas sp. PP-CC-3A-396]